MPMSMKQIQASYSTSPYFKEIYKYLAQNKLPNPKVAIFQIEILSERYIQLHFCYLSCFWS